MKIEGKLNIGDIGGGVSQFNLGLDASGNVVTGSTATGAQDLYWINGTGEPSIKTISGSNIASGNYSIAQGYQTIANGFGSHAEGISVTLEGLIEKTTASNFGSHAQGVGTKAIGRGSHSEGSTVTEDGTTIFYVLIASGDSSHAEGGGTEAFGDYSHSQGYRTKASGTTSHSQGFKTEANGINSFASGNKTIANGLAGFVHSRHDGSTKKVINDADYGAILGGQNGYLSSTAINSILLGGQGLSGYSSNTVYTQKLNIKEPLSNTMAVNIGLDADNNVVTGTTTDTREQLDLHTSLSTAGEVIQLVPYAFYGFYIKELFIQTDTGSVNATVRRNSDIVGGLGDISGGPTNNIYTASTNNVAIIGSKITLIINSINAATELYISIKTKRDI